MNILGLKGAKRFCIHGDTEIRRFADAIGDTNPLHHDKKIAQEIYGLKGIIAPGVMVTGFISATLAAEIPGAQVRRMNLKFIHPVYAPSLHIVVQYEVTEQKRNVAKVLVTIMNGDEKTAEGYCILLLP